MKLTEQTTKELLIAYKNKARCIYSEAKAESIYRELENRIGRDELQILRTETWHIQHGESDAMFNDECDRLLKAYCELSIKNKKQ